LCKLAAVSVTRTESKQGKVEMNKSTISALALGLIVLAACGGGADRDAQYVALLSLYEGIEDGNLPSVDVSSRAGQATLNGIVGVGNVGDDNELEVIGDLTIAADFDADVATGSASGFTLFNMETGAVENDVDGTLTMANGTISGTDFDGTLSGTLTDEGDDVNVALILDGGFYDHQGTLVVAGDLDATITESDGTTLIREGGFLAE
jgi:hypothetical protein